MIDEKPDFIMNDSVAADGALERRVRELLAEEDGLLTPEQRKRLEEKAERAMVAELKDERVEVNGTMMTRSEWREFMHECPHEHFSYPGVELMDGSKMAICDRCKFIQHEAIAKMIEGEEDK